MDCLFNGRQTFRGAKGPLPDPMSAVAAIDDSLQALQLRHRLESLRRGPNPKLVSFASDLQGDPDVAGRWWAQRMLGDAQDCIGALWEPSLAPDDAMPSLRAAIRHAVAHGLVACVGYLQAAFLPGGRALPGPQLAMFKEDFSTTTPSCKPAVWPAGLSSKVFVRISLSWASLKARSTRARASPRSRSPVTAWLSLPVAATTADSVC